MATFLLGIVSCSKIVEHDIRERIGALILYRSQFFTVGIFNARVSKLELFFYDLVNLLL